MVNDHTTSGKLQSILFKNQKSQFVEAKKKVMEIYHRASHIPVTGKIEVQHDLQEKKYDPKYLQLFDPIAIKESFAKLTRQVKRFENKMAKTGGIMRMRKIPY